MNRGVPESDWKVFREVREAALQRFCKRVLDGLDRFQHDDCRTYHDRYIDLFRWIQDRDKEMARAFDDPRRSAMLWQLATIHSLGLVEPGELTRFTSETRQAVEALIST